VFIRRYYSDKLLYLALASCGVLPAFFFVLEYFTGTHPFSVYSMVVAVLWVFLELQSRMISTDPLTKLNNRNQLNVFLDSKMGQNSAKGSLYLFVLDVDKFKDINDNFGHHEGDRALVLVASALKRVCARAECPIFLCRYGGDEFLLIARTDEPGKISDLIHSELSESSSQIQKHKKMPYTIQASVGYVSWDGDVSHFKDSLKLADNKMYEQKKTNPTKIKSA
jgi:diguanylate cyclase (GGDEF)-like protein